MHMLLVLMTLVSSLALVDSETDTGTDTSTDTSTDTDTGTDTDTDTGSESDTGSGSDSTDSDGGEGFEGCGGVSCAGAGPAVRITSPADGAQVASPFVVEISLGSFCYCDTCGCTTMSVDAADLLVDGEFAGATVASGDDHVSIEVDLPPGTHELIAVPTNEGSSSDPITVTVIGGDPIEGGAEAGSDSATAGCGCMIGETGSGLGGLLLLGLLALRRRPEQD